MNKVILTGNLTREPKLAYTQSGKARLAVGIAVQRGIKRDEVDFFNLAAWEKTAEFISKYFTKGSRIFILGRLQTNNYKDTNGVMHYGVDVIVESVEFGNSKREETPADNAPPPNDFDDKNFDDNDFIGEEIPDYKVPF